MYVEQAYPTFLPQQKNCREIQVSRKYNYQENPKSIPYAKCYFDKDGLMTAWYFLCRTNNPCGKKVYTYQGKKLTKYQQYSTQVMDSTQTYQDDMMDVKMVWDSTVLGVEVHYKIR